MNTLAPRLRPMNLGEIIDATFALYRANFALFAGVVAVLAVPKAILGIVLALSAPPPPVFTPGISATSNVNLGAYYINSGVSDLINFVFSTLITGALAQAVSARYLGQRISVAQAYALVGVGTFVTLGAATIVEAFGLTLASIALILPGIYFFVRWSFISQAIVLEGKGVFSAFSRSSELVSGSWWRVFGIEIVLVLLVTILSAITGGLAGAIFAFTGTTLGRVLGTLGATVGSILVGPIGYGGITLLYFDLRIRKEGFDIQQMATRWPEGTPGL